MNQLNQLLCYFKTCQKCDWMFNKITFSTELKLSDGTVYLAKLEGYMLYLNHRNIKAY